MSDGASCAHCRVSHTPRDNDDGTRTSLWTCNDCGAEFVPRRAVEAAPVAPSEEKPIPCAGCDNGIDPTCPAKCPREEPKHPPGCIGPNQSAFDCPVCDPRKAVADPKPYENKVLRYQNCGLPAIPIPTAKEPKRCERCDGTGTDRVCKCEDKHPLECPACGGTGLVPKCKHGCEPGFCPVCDGWGPRSGTGGATEEKP